MTLDILVLSLSLKGRKKTNQNKTKTHKPQKVSKGEQEVNSGKVFHSIQIKDTQGISNDYIIWLVPLGQSHVLKWKSFESEVYLVFNILVKQLKDCNEENKQKKMVNV